mgnify:CR=1 FL=1
MNQKGVSVVIILASLLIIGVVGFAAYRVVNSNEAEINSSEQTTEQSEAVENAPAAEQVQTEAGKTVHFKTEDDKAAYAIGASVSRYIEKTLAEQEQWIVLRRRQKEREINSGM